MDFIRLRFVSAWTLGAAYCVLLLWATARADGLGLGTRVGLLAAEVALVPLAIWVARETKRRIVAEVELLALRDDLTGLSNRKIFMDRLRDALARSQRNHMAVGVLLLDFDRFKSLNDTLGHAAGDGLLIQAADRFARSTRAGELAARIGGDEFAFVLEGLKGVGGARAAAARLQSLLQRPFTLDGHQVGMTASIGIALNEGSFCPADELLRRADVALYQAKADGRNCQRVFDARRESRNFEALDVGAGLSEAIERNELILYFQPEIDLSSGLIAGFEALVRWNHPRLGLLGPGAFVRTAEESGQIRELGRWVLSQACHQAVELASRFPELGETTFSINVSPIEFNDPALADTIAASLAKTGLAPGRLKLEILETALMIDPDATALTLRELRQLGIKIAIDDFGTGYSSLSYLRRFPVDTLKIDQSFVKEAHADRQAKSIIEAVVALAHVLGIDVTAEGVETNPELYVVMSAGCDRAQGFLFSRPLPVEALNKYLTSALEKASSA